MTYHLWAAVDVAVFQPRFVMLEVNPAFAPPDSRTVPPNVTHWDGNDDYYGASLSALEIVSRSKGYTLVYVDVTGERAVFVHQDVLEDALGRTGLSIAADGASASVKALADVGQLHRPPNLFRSGGGYAQSKGKLWFRVQDTA